MRRGLLLIVPLLLMGANEAKKSEYFKVLMQKRDPYTFDKKARLELQKAKIEATTKEKLATIEYKKTIEAAKIAKESKSVQAKAEIEKSKIAAKPKIEEAEAKKKAFGYLFWLGLVALAIFAWLFRWYYSYKKRIELQKMELEREAHERELAMREKELQAQMAGKLIDALASGKLTKEQEEKLLKIAGGSDKLLGR